MLDLRWPADAVLNWSVGEWLNCNQHGPGCKATTQSFSVGKQFSRARKIFVPAAPVASGSPASPLASPSPQLRPVQGRER